MRYFTFNFIAKKHYYINKFLHVESIAGEIHIQSVSFPPKTTIVDLVNGMHENLEDITIINKFEFNNEQDFRDYVGSWRIVSLLEE